MKYSDNHSATAVLQCSVFRCKPVLMVAFKQWPALALAHSLWRKLCQVKAPLFSTRVPLGLLNDIQWKVAPIQRTTSCIGLHWTRLEWNQQIALFVWILTHCVDSDWWITAYKLQILCKRMSWLRLRERDSNEDTVCQEPAQLFETRPAASMPRTEGSLFQSFWEKINYVCFCFPGNRSIVIHRGTKFWLLISTSNVPITDILWILN